VSAGSAGATHLTRSTHLTNTAGHVAAAVPVQAAPKAAASAPDPDNIQQGSQSGQQDNSGGPDTTTGSAGESTGAEADGPGGHTDPAGSAGQQGDFNN
jgi:hypothetical protein